MPIGPMLTNLQPVATRDTCSISPALSYDDRPTSENGPIIERPDWPELEGGQLTARDFDRLPRILRRYTPAHLYYLIRQPRRRRRFIRQAQAIASRWKKSACAQKKVGGATLVVGPLSDTNGLGRAARYEVDRLRGECARLQVVDVRRETPVSIRHRIASGDLVPPETLIVLAQPDNYKLVFPLFEPGFLARAWRIGQLVWEMQYCPDEWMFVRDLLHEFWAPSRFSAEAIAGGLGLPYEVRPHPVIVPDVPPMERSRFGVADDDFLGLAIMDLRACPDRKNPLAHVEAWKLAFGRNSKCKLLMKVRFQKRTQIVRRELLELIGDYPNISLVEDVFTDDEITAFQKMGNVYLSLHRSEGFGLNIAEALEIGLPVIATSWSAPAEYMPNYEHAIPITFRQVPYEDYWRAYSPKHQLTWAEPNVQHAAMMLRRLALGSSDK